MDVAEGIPVEDDKFPSKRIFEGRAVATDDNDVDDEGDKDGE